MPVEWDMELDPTGFDQASDELGRAFGPGTPGDYGRRAQAACAELVEALRTLRHRHPALREVYMTVVATDSGELWTELEGQAVLSLNGPGVAKSWQEWRESWL
jgi:hypothetical protein